MVAPSESGVTAPATETSEPVTVEVTEEHPDVTAIVDAAVKAAEGNEVTLSPEVWIEVLEEAIQDLERQKRIDDPTGPKYACVMF